MSSDLNRPPRIDIRVQTQDFDHGLEYGLLRDHDSQPGAIVTFTGLVRDLNLGKSVIGLFLEHYPIMTEKALSEIVDDALKRWSLSAVTVIHRVGDLSVNQQIVFVGVCAKHRAEAFDACQFIMDYLKTRAPFWKKERRQDEDVWVEEKHSDIQAAQKW